MLVRTEERIRHAALQLFVRQGFAATGIRQIAAEAGVTTASLYHYIGTKDDLLISIMRDVTETLHQAATQALARVSAPEMRLATLVQVHVYVHGVRKLSAFVADTELRSLVGETREQVLGLRDRYEGLWRDVITSGVTSGIFQVDDTKLASIALLEMCTGVSHWYSAGGRLPLPEICRHYADCALAMVRAARDGRTIRATELHLRPPQEFYPAGEVEVMADAVAAAMP